MELPKNLFFKRTLRIIVIVILSLSQDSGLLKAQSNEISLRTETYLFGLSYSRILSDKIQIGISSGVAKLQKENDPHHVHINTGNLFTIKISGSYFLSKTVENCSGGFFLNLYYARRFIHYANWVQPYPFEKSIEVKTNMGEIGLLLGYRWFKNSRIILDTYAGITNNNLPFQIGAPYLKSKFNLRDYYKSNGYNLHLMRNWPMVGVNLGYRF